MLTLNRRHKQELCFTYRGDEEGRTEFRERNADRDRDRERLQKEKERVKRQDENRRRRRERQDGENSYRKQEDEVKREKALEKKKGEHMTDSHSERPEKVVKDNKKDDVSKRERLRNKVMTLKSFSSVSYICI